MKRISIALAGLLLASCTPDRSPDESRRETAQFIIDRTGYAYDDRTDMCFSVIVQGQGVGTANVECTPQVMMLAGHPTFGVVSSASIPEEGPVTWQIPGSRMCVVEIITDNKRSIVPTGCNE